MSTTQVFTASGARELDRAAAAEAGARAAQQQVVTREAAALAEIRVGEARAEAADRARQREAERRAALGEQAAARKAEQDRARAERRAARAAMWTHRRPLLVVFPMMGVSAAVALPAQFAYYESATNSAWSGATIAAMVEGGTWLGAALESSAINRRKPAGFYRALTWSLAGTAAAVNLAHGMTMTGGGWQVGVVFALASLMGVVAWSAYVRLRTHQDSETSAEHLRLAMWRRLRYPRLSWRALSLRAAIGPALSIEDAWVQVWAEHHASRPVRWWDQTTPAVLAPASVAPPEPVPVLVEVDQLDPPGAVPAVEVDPISAGARAIPAAEADPFGTLDLLELVDPLPPALQAVAIQSPRPARVEARPVAPVWIEPPALDPVEVDPLDPADAERVEELLGELGAAIEDGDLPAEPSAEAVRKHLGIAWRTGRELLGEHERRMRAAGA